jgi:precorrin-2 dehydrogenase/sirohydrochlorin ferrochelatase
MSGYPVALQLEGRNCLLVGGGPVAERKAAGLLDGGADRLTVISPAATPGLERLGGQGRLELRRRLFQPGDAAGMFLVVAATGIPEVDRAVMEEAGNAGALFNHASQGEAGDFITAAAVRRGELLLAVTTGGSSPSLAVVIREELEKLYGAPYAEAAARLAELKRKLQAEEPDGSLRRRLLRREAQRLADWAAAECRQQEDTARSGAEGEGEFENR